MNFRYAFAALAFLAAPAMAGPFDQDPYNIGKNANEWFASRTMTARFSDPKCREGAHLKSCLFTLGTIEIVSQGKPGSTATSKISVQLNSQSRDDAAQFMIASIAIMALQSPNVSQEAASNEFAQLMKGAAAEGKQSKILDGTYFSIMKIGSEFVFTAMPE